MFLRCSDIYPNERSRVLVLPIMLGGTVTSLSLCIVGWNCKSVTSLSLCVTKVSATGSPSKSFDVNQSYLILQGLQKQCLLNLHRTHIKKKKQTNNVLESPPRDSLVMEFSISRSNILSSNSTNIVRCKSVTFNFSSVIYPSVYILFKCGLPDTTY